MFKEPTPALSNSMFAARLNNGFGLRFAPAELTVLPATPVSIASSDSKLNLAAKPPPKSSVPRRPQRDVDKPPEIACVFETPAVLTRPTPASIMPYKVTLD